MTTTTQLEQLAQHEEALAQAKATEQQREEELAARTRHLTALRDESAEYQRAVGAGAERDAEREGAFAELGGSGHVEVHRSGYGRDWWEVVDRDAEARRDGAREARESREAELRRYAHEHREQIEAELEQGMEADREVVAGAADQLAAALEPMQARERRARKVRLLAGWTSLPEFVPGYRQLDDLARAIREVVR